MSSLASSLLESAFNSLANGRKHEAMILLSKLFLSDPGDKSNFIILSDLCQMDFRWRELEKFAEVRLLHVANDGEALCRLAQVMIARKEFAKALICLEQAITYNPEHAKAIIEYSRLLKILGDIDNSIRFLQKAESFDPGSSTASDNLVFSMLFSDKYTPEEVFKAHVTRCHGYNQMHSVSQHFEVNERMRIGYVSPDFREHSVASFLEPVIRSHDRSIFDIYCYHTNPEEDAVTARFKVMPVMWRNISELDDSAALNMIREDRINLLVDLAGFTAWNRLSLFALRPAPIQATWLGYPHSTGMNAIDYRITDNIADPPGMTENLHSEKLFRLPGTFLCFQQHESCMTRLGSPCLNNGGMITFASFNNIAKATPKNLDCWREILQILPNSRLILKSEIFADPEATAMVMKRLELGSDRVITLGSTPDRGSHLALYNQVDIALDTFPYHGTTTTCEALSMGVPVLTLAGKHHAARVGVSLLMALGRKELIAWTAEEYVRIAVELAKDIQRLNSLHNTLSRELEASVLTDETGFTAGLESAYLQMWRRHCVSSGEPPR